MKNFLYCLFALFLPLQALAQEPAPALNDILQQLDDAIVRKAEFRRQREEQLERLKQQTSKTQGYNRVALLKEIFGLYSHFQTDSAQLCLNELARLPEVKNNPEELAYVSVAQAEIYAVTGMYAEAIDRLKAVDSHTLTAQNLDLRLFYYRTQRTLYGWMADFASLSRPQQQWRQLMETYRDTLLQIEDAGLNRDIVKADQLIDKGRSSEAIALLRPYLKHDAERGNPYLCFTLSRAYRMLSDADSELHYLTLTAIADIRRGITEYQALPILAQRLSERSDVERAYRCLICSMEDAGFCKARLRTVEANSVFPIIDKQYKQIECTQRRRDLVLMALLALSLIGVTALLVYTFKQVKKLRQLREAQLETNCRLEAANERAQEAMGELREANLDLQRTYNELQLTDKMKEEYIGRYLNRCRDYLDDLAAYRRNSLRLLKEHRIDDLTKELKSEGSMAEEKERFYADFDEAFLTLFPNFIDKFNALLPEADRIHPKHENHLNTDLRIFALIRLGVTETSRIAHFLNYSTNTVYNYRSKIRNKALCGSENFEQLVMKL